MLKGDLLYAGFWVRFFAGLLDLVFMIPIVLILIYFFGVSDYEYFHMSGNSYAYRDFIQTEHYGQISNDYLITLRRFAHPVPDDILSI